MTVDPQAEPLGDVATRLLFENERVRVWEMDLAPGASSDLHHHALDYLLVILEGDRIVARAQGEGPESRAADREAEVQPGQVFYVKAGGTETACNIGSQRYHEILIELKDGGAGATGPTGAAGAVGAAGAAEGAGAAGGAAS